MAKQTLPVNYVNDTLASAMNGLRRYRQINNADGTVSFEDVTDYDVVGNDFGATQLNATNQAVNESADKGKIIDDIDVIGAVTEEGYIAGALALKKVNESLNGLIRGTTETFTVAHTKTGTLTITIPERSNTDYIVLLTPVNYSLTDCFYFVLNKTTTSFTISLWNNGTSGSRTAQFNYIVLG